MRFLRILSAVVLAPSLTYSEVVHESVIPNALNHTWPHEHVSFDLPVDKAAQVQSVEVQGRRSPAQLEPVLGGRGRIWTTVRIERDDDSTSPPVRFHSEAVEPGIRLTETDDELHIANGVHELRIRRYPDTAVTWAEVPHWLAGIRLDGADPWTGEAAFRFPEDHPLREARLTARTEILAAGPVHVDVRVTLADEPMKGLDPGVGLRMDPGKRSHLFEPNVIPRIPLPPHEVIYEAVIRVVAGDPWIDVTERYHFPTPEGMRVPWQEMTWGREGLALDTVLWTRWFEYDRFGGNDRLLTFPLRPREEQKGRPFSQLRPRWHQGGGGGQETFATRGGARPGRDASEEEREAYDADAPAIGMVAAFASKWVNPGPQTIAVDAEAEEFIRFRLPLADGNPRVTGIPWGHRGYGLVMAPRGAVDDTGRMNSLVRRHTDWTLTAQINAYILEWERDPDLAGPHILLARDELTQLRAAAEGEGDAHLVEALAESRRNLEALEARKEELEAAVREAEGEAREELRRQLRDVNRSLGGSDQDLLRMVLRGTRRQVGTPPHGLFRGRRYQDDFLNPTQQATRRMSTYALIDLFADGRPVGGAADAAAGYIFSDPDHWPGWHNGWHPGNPNFHTDKYMGAIYVAASMLDHPHARQWLQYGWENFLDDISRVVVEPDGTGWECPGYSGYSLRHQLELAQVFMNTGFGNPVTGHPPMWGTGRWHRKLLTPLDPRRGFRHAAPIGDTHRWRSGLNDGFRRLARFFREADPEFASEMMGTWAMLESMGFSAGSGDFVNVLFDAVRPIPPMAPEAMDWSSEPFHGFGAILRNGFGTDDESFVSIKAGHLRGHYHNDENSHHVYLANRPVMLDYNCSYSPRGDHAALHNSFTFGRDGTVRNHQRGEDVDGMEQIHDTAHAAAFATSDALDVFVSERSGTRLSLRPWNPLDAEFARGYPGRSVNRIVHRRFTALVKHPEGAPLRDYLVILDEVVSAEPAQINLHLLARSAEVEAGRTRLVGQLDTDATLWFSQPLEPEVRGWGYHAEGSYRRRDGLEDLKVPEGHEGPWTAGEYQIWLRGAVDTERPLLTVLHARRRGEPEPAVTFDEDGRTVHVAKPDSPGRGGERGADRVAVLGADTLHLSTEGGVWIERDGRRIVLLAPDEIPPLGEVENRPVRRIAR